MSLAIPQLLRRERRAMQLSTKALEQFKKMYEEKYEIQLSDEEALEFGIRLIKLVKAVYGNRIPIIDKYKNKENN